MKFVTYNLYEGAQPRFGFKKNGYIIDIVRASIWIKKDQEYFYDSIRSFNSSTNLFKSKSLEKIISGEDYQKKWYLSNLANWHLSRSTS